MLTVVFDLLTICFRHNVYVTKFILCEVLNLVNVFGQMWLMDIFFGGQFTLYGLEVGSLTILLSIGFYEGDENNKTEY